MAYASGSQRGASYVAETTYGVTPTSPTMLPIRNTGANLALTRNALEDAEINPNRQMKNMRSGNKQVSGDISFQLSYGDFDDFLAAVMCDDWTSGPPDTLVVGSTLNSFTVEDRFTDINQYLVYTGIVMDQFKLSVQPGDTGAYVTGSFSTIGKDQSVSGTSLGTPSASSGNSPFSTCDGTIKVGGNPVQIFNSMEFTIANNIASNFVIGDCSVDSLTLGQMQCTGTLGAFFEDATYLNNFINEDDIELELVLTDLDSNSLTFNFPRVRLTTATPGNEEQSINLSLEFTALYDATDTTTLTISRS